MPGRYFAAILTPGSRRRNAGARGIIPRGSRGAGEAIGRIQTFVPSGRALPPGTFDVGIALREDVRGRGYGREALALLTDWLFEHAAAQVVEAPTDPANVAMRTVFERVGWQLAGSQHELGREWVVYRITRPQWQARAAAG